MPPLGEATVPAAVAVRRATSLIGALLDDAVAVRPAAASACGPAGGRLRRAARALAAAVVAAHERLLATSAFRGTRGGALPVVEPTTLPAAPREAPEASLDVPVLVGTNADEATFFFHQPGRVLDPDAETLRRMVVHQPGGGDAEAVLRRVRAAAPGADANEPLLRVATQAVFEAPVGAWVAARPRRVAWSTATAWSTARHSPASAPATPSASHCCSAPTPRRSAPG